MAYTIELYANNVRTTLAGSANNTVTTLVLQSGAGALLPSPNNLIGEYAKVTLQDLATGLRNEIVYITARTGDILTVVRGQDGSAAQTWSAGDIVFEGVTAATLASFVQPSKVQTNQYVFATATGSPIAYNAALTPAVAVLTDGMIISVDTGTVGTNTITNPTLNVNGLGVITIVKEGGALSVGDMPKFSQLQYNATLTQWILLNPVPVDYSSKVVPVGACFHFATATPPAGYLERNGSAKSRSTYAELFNLLVTSQGFAAVTFTVAISTNALVTCAGHGFTGNERLRLSTTGALPTGLNTASDYYVIYVSSTTFRLSLTPNATTGITTSGTQSGVHSFLCSLYGLGDGSTTFNVPDSRALVDKGLDNGAGIDTNRIIGSYQDDMYKSHTHSAAANFGNVLVSAGGGTGGTGAGGSLDVYQTGITVYASGGIETRVKTIALLPCIKY